MTSAFLLTDTSDPAIVDAVTRLPACRVEVRRSAELADVVDFVRDHDVRTIYFETLVSPAVARTVAGATGARTAVLDPVEGVTEASAGPDYLTIMRANLVSLREGQPCR